MGCFGSKSKKPATAKPKAAIQPHRFVFKDPEEPGQVVRSQAPNKLDDRDTLSTGQQPNRRVAPLKKPPVHDPATVSHDWGCDTPTSILNDAPFGKSRRREDSMDFNGLLKELEDLQK